MQFKTRDCEIEIQYSPFKAIKLIKNKSKETKILLYKHIPKYQDKTFIRQIYNQDLQLVRMSLAAVSK